MYRRDLSWPVLTAFKTTIGVNPWVVHRDTHVFGEDVEQFRPERWLEIDDSSNMGKLLQHASAVGG